MNTLLIVLIGVLQIGDVLTTEHILSKGGAELNPVMNWLFTKFGMHNVLVAKALLVTSVAILASALAPIALIPLAIVYLVVVGWNSYQIWSVK